MQRGQMVQITLGAAGILSPLSPPSYFPPEYVPFTFSIGLGMVLLTLLMHYVDVQLKGIEDHLAERIRAWGVELKNTPRVQLTAFVEQIGRNAELHKQAVEELKTTPQIYTRHVNARIASYDGVRAKYLALLKDVLPAQAKAEELELAEVAISDFYTESAFVRARALDLLKRIP